MFYEGFCREFLLTSVTSNDEKRGKSLCSVFLLSSGSCFIAWTGFIAWGPNDVEGGKQLHTGLSGKHLRSEMSGQSLDCALFIEHVVTQATKSRDFVSGC